MLVKCPKCGFNQPHDRYCANCGIDMEGYKPQRPSVFKQIATSPFLYILIVFGLVFGTILFIKKKQHEELVSRIEFLKSGPVVVDKKDTSAQNTTMAASIPESPAEEALPPAAEPSSAANQSPTPTSDTLNSASTATSSAPLGQKLADNPAPTLGKGETAKLKATYVELEPEAKEEFLSETFQLPRSFSFGDLQVGMIRNLEPKLRRQRVVHVLEKVIKVFSPNKMSHQWFLGSKEGDFELGLTTMVTLESIENGVVKGEVEILRSFKEAPDGPPVKKNFPVSTFELPSKHAWMMMAQIPRVAQDDPSDPINDGIMQVFHSPSFQNKKSEFTLFLEFDTSSSSQDEGGRNEATSPQRN